MKGPCGKRTRGVRGAGEGGEQGGDASMRRVDQVSEGEPGEEVGPVSAKAKWGIKPVEGRTR